MKKQLLLIALLFSFYINSSFAQTVYVTKSGKKYHTAECRYTNNNSTALSLSDAINKGYEACKICKPASSSLPPGSFANPDNGSGNIDDSYQNYSTEKVQCLAITKSGNRCKRTTKSPNGKCWQHGGN